MSQIEIKKIIIKVGSKEVTFTLDEVKELQEILNKTFGAFGDREIIYVPNTPIIIERPVYPPYRWWQVEYNNTSQALCCSNKDQEF